MSAQIDPMDEPARWQRSLLPGGMVAGPDAPRSARDWTVDVLATLLSLVGGVVLIAIQHYDDARWMLDATLGLAAIVALWWRRRHPVGVAVGTMLVSIISASAGIAALVALFSATTRASREGLFTVWAVALVAAVLYPLVLPTEDGYWLDLTLGILVT